MGKGVLILIVVVVFFLALGGWFIGGLNRVVILDENVDQSWAQVENQLQRRNDLVFNLVRTVQGYAAHERGLLTKVTELRSQWTKAASRGEKIEAATEMSGALSRLLLVAENYPDLKADQSFLTMQSQLEGTENRIAVERRRYNQAVMAFNSYKRSVFGSLFARLRGLTQSAEYFEAEEEAFEVPVVQF